MNEIGVFGGSMLGATFFHASRNSESAAGDDDRSVERGRAEALTETIADLPRRPEARRSMAEGVFGDRSACAGSEIGTAARRTKVD